MIFVDTNYFIRYLVGDIPQQQEKAKKLFSQGSKGEAKLFTSTLVIFEIYWVFKSFYKKPKTEVIKILSNVLSMKFIELKEREIVLDALRLFQKANIELQDCYNLAYANAHKKTHFATFDRKLVKHV